MKYSFAARSLKRHSGGRHWPPSSEAEMRLASRISVGGLRNAGRIGTVSRIGIAFAAEVERYEINYPSASGGAVHSRRLG
jgi:hypothetical protein